MSADRLDQAKNLTIRPYLVMTAKSETTDGQPIYNARTLEIEGCIGQGDTPESAVQDLRDVLIDYIEGLLEDGLEVPEPTQLVRTERTGISETFISIPITLINRVPNQNIQQKPVEQIQDKYFLRVLA
jgi:predicted RNase H-like HicB family nuclease